jgi:site-specific DNA-methyltransferase (adenine-specific)
MILSIKPKIEVIRGDNLDYMKSIPDNFFALAIVDPPYGDTVKGDMIKYRTPKISSKQRNTYGKAVEKVKYKDKDWDVKPSKEYWKELFRVSKNQIVWGGNHFPLPLRKGWIFWDKLQQEQASFSHGELAWTSFNQRIRKFTHQWAGFAKTNPEKRIHETQKPVELYEYCILNFAKEGDNILDTHLGSGSSAIAAFKLGFDFTGIEIDKDHYRNGKNRIKKYIDNYSEPLYNLNTIRK